jgi:hypothetical protein
VVSGRAMLVIFIKTERSHGNLENYNLWGSGKIMRSPAS